MSDGPVPHPAPAVTAGTGDGDDLAARIAAAVLAVEDVVGLSAGPAGQFRTYLPGGASVAGVRVDDERIAVDVVVRYGPALPELGDRIAAALTGLHGGRPVTVTVADLVLPGDPEPDPADSGVDDDPRDGHDLAT